MDISYKYVDIRVLYMYEPLDTLKTYRPRCYRTNLKEKVFREIPRNCISNEIDNLLKYAKIFDIYIDKIIVE